MSLSGGSGSGSGDGGPGGGSDLNQQTDAAAGIIQNTEEPNTDNTQTVDNRERSDDQSTPPGNTTAGDARVRRKTKFSVRGAESKITELNLSIVRSINAQYKRLDRAQREVVQGISFDDMLEICEELETIREEVKALYDQLITLCDGDENKIGDKTKSMFSHFMRDISSFQESLEQQLDTLEQEQLLEAEQQIEQANRELEEEERIFEEFMRQREASPIGPPVLTRTSTPSSADSTAPRLVNQQRPSRTSTSELRAHRTGAEDVRVTTPAPDTNSTPAPAPSSELDVVMKLTKSLVDALGNRKSVEPATFTGDALQFADWEVDLDSYLRVERIEGKERLRHMKKFVDGEARKCLEGYFTTNTDEAYTAARATLKERYGSEHKVARDFRKKLDNWPKVSPRDGKALREYSDFLSHLLSAMSTIKPLAILNDCVENERMVEKIPEWLRIKWARVVAKAELNKERYPTFSEFAQFIKEEAHIMTLPISQSLATHGKPKERDHNKPSQPRTTKSFAVSTVNQAKCLSCGMTNHPTSSCYRLQEKPKTEREQFMKSNRLCFRCLEPGHRSKTCEKKPKCLICHKFHATANHESNWRNNKEVLGKGANQEQQVSVTQTTLGTKPAESEEGAKPPEPAKALNCRATGVAGKLVNMAVPVYVSAGTGREVLVYALLDNMSDACYISKEVLDKLKPRVSEIEQGVTIRTINGSATEDMERYDGITLRGYMTDNCAKVSAYKTDQIYCDKEQLPTPAKAKKLEHMKDVAEQMPPLMDIPIGLLLGNDVPEVIQPLESRTADPGKTGKAYAAKTLFGWTMCGGVPGKEGRSRVTYLTQGPKNPDILQLLQQDFRDIGGEEAYVSQDDLKFTRILQSSTKQQEDGSYIMPLPFKTHPDPPDLPDNRAQAEKRFKVLLKKFESEPGYREEYGQFMDNLISAGHAEKVPEDGTMPGHVWYMPHFAVRHKQKKKLRVVFDASAKFQGVAINDVLLGGPDHMNSLLGILLRFRREPIAISCDIQQMFYNFLVAPEHRDYLRFLWTDENGKTAEYRMNVHLFGAKSSPGVATFGLRRLAGDYQLISPEAATFLREDFYVDDGVTSVATQNQAADLIEHSREICLKGNIRLHKFLSNDKRVLSTVPASERGESTKDLDLLKDQLPSERTLGMKWGLESDTFHFDSPANANKPPTKRGILSTVAQIYDPMGMVAPFVLTGKQILQKVASEEQSWDQLISPSLQIEWERWVSDLPKLNVIQIPRCFKAGETVSATELHHFADGSLAGYGACSYIRQLTSQGTVTCHLVLAKARVAPLKKLTVPRLELQAAVTAVRLASTLRRELRVDIQKEVFWTDSQIVLGYIANDSKRFHMYVANRVEEIKQTTGADQWHHVRTEDNPADLASRGGTAADLLNGTMWYEGPDFLKEADISPYIKGSKAERTLDPDDPEIRKPKLTMATQTTAGSITDRFRRYGKWTTLVRSVAIIQCCIRQRSWRRPELKPADLKAAEEFIVRTVQREQYPTMVNEKSLVKLTPKLDSNGIMRVGGRLSAAMTLNDQQRYPMVIPKNTHLAALIVRHYHEKIFHLGRRSTLAAIRDAGYWVVNGSGQVKRWTANCVGCARLRKAPEEQLMGEHPEQRLERTAPFTHVGIDVFGPYYVKDRRTELKRWGLLITCLYSRAIHIELLEDMSTDTLIQALRCFMATRGPVHTIYCDNGTNFVGAKNELEKEFQSATSNMKQYLLANQIDFQMNAPYASHQGGATERMIRSVRAVMNGMALKHKNRLDTKTLRTMFCEAANVVNSRPLTSTTVDDPEDRVITPHQMLTMKQMPLLAPPPGEFPSEFTYCTKRWKVAQALAQEFWEAWKSEYLEDLMVRQKWDRTRKNIKEGDVVIIKEPNAARNEWKMGRVTEAITGDDGLVRNVTVRLANPLLDKKGVPIVQPTHLKRSVQSVILLLSE